MDAVDSLEFVPLEKWKYLQDAFNSDHPRGISGNIILETQKNLLKSGFDYGFKVMCPFGEVNNGMVAVNEKDTLYEIIIQCPSDNTEKLEAALKTTRQIDWNRDIVVPFAPNHIIECIKRVAEEIKIEIDLISQSESFILKKNTPLFENVSLPPSISFGHLTSDHVDLVNSTWPHRYPGSTWYFHLLINFKSGFGLFENDSLISWVFINDAGVLGHMFSLNEHRRKGYAELLLKLVSNVLLEQEKHVIAYAVKGNTSACGLYKKLGFEDFVKGIAWCYLKGRESLKYLTLQKGSLE